MTDLTIIKDKLEKLGLYPTQIEMITYFLLCQNRDKDKFNYTIYNWYINEENEVSIVYTLVDETKNTIKYVYSVLRDSSFCQQWSNDRTYEYFEKTYQRIQASKEIEIL